MPGRTAPSVPTINTKGALRYLQIHGVCPSSTPTKNLVRREDQGLQKITIPRSSVIDPDTIADTIIKYIAKAAEMRKHERGWQEGRCCAPFALCESTAKPQLWAFPFAACGYCFTTINMLVQACICIRDAYNEAILRVSPTIFLTDIVSDLLFECLRYRFIGLTRAKHQKAPKSHSQQRGSTSGKKRKPSNMGGARLAARENVIAQAVRFLAPIEHVNLTRDAGRASKAERFQVLHRELYWAAPPATYNHESFSSGVLLAVNDAIDPWHLPSVHQVPPPLPPPPTSFFDNW
jgi:hypothetical protein